jgi:hypothetical protein
MVLHRPSVFHTPKIAQGETLLVSLCTLFLPATGPRSPAARRESSVQRRRIRRDRVSQSISGATVGALLTRRVRPILRDDLACKTELLRSLRTMTFAASRDRRLAVRAFLDAVGIARRSSLRRTGCVRTAQRIGIVHFPCSIPTTRDTYVK